jgi:hypothetical protein
MKNINLRFIIFISYYLLIATFAPNLTMGAEEAFNFGKDYSDVPRVSVYVVGGEENSFGPFDTGQGFLAPAYAKGPTGAIGPGYFLSSPQVMADILGTTNLSQPNALLDDPAIRCYTPKSVSVDIESLLAQELVVRRNTLLQISDLDLSGRCFQTHIFDFLCGSEVDLSCIRKINVSCAPGKGAELDANQFLLQLFQNSRSLRSLMFIDIGNSNVTLDTLKVWRITTDFNGPLIRDLQIFSANTGVVNTGWNVAQLTFKNVSLTPILKNSITEKRDLQRATQRTVKTLYRAQKYKEADSHLQIILE